MPVEKIRERILADAKREAEEILKTAREEAKEFLQTQKKKIDREKKEKINQEELKGLSETERVLTLARLEARDAVLKDKQEALEEVFQQSLRQIQDLEESKYQKIIKEMLLKKAEGYEEVIFNQRDQKRFGLKLIKQVNEGLKKRGKIGNLKLSAEKRKITSGFILRHDKIEENYSFETLLTGLREEIEPKVSAILFRGEERERGLSKFL